MPAGGPGDGWSGGRRADDRRGVRWAAAERLNVTQIVIGQPARTRRWRALLAPSPVHDVLAQLTYADLRIVGWKTPFSTATAAGSFPSDPPIKASPRPRGQLTIYVGAAPGVGKTFRMLQDARDWRARGVDVVIGLIETHGREDTRREIADLPIVPQKRMQLAGRTYQELDPDAILARRPQVVLIDELAHSNVPGSARDKRYQDIVFLLNHGIDVVTAVNIQHLESLTDKVAHITGVKVRERVPRLADAPGRWGPRPNFGGRQSSPTLRAPDSAGLAAGGSAPGPVVGAGRAGDRLIAQLGRRA